MPFHVISYQMAVKLRRDKEKQYNIKYLTRTTAFKTPQFIRDSYDEGLRRFHTKDDPKPYALSFSKYEELYRHIIMKDTKKVGELRALYNEAKRSDVYLVDEWKETPEMKIILDLIKVRGNSGVWG